MINKQDKIYLAGHNGMVGSAVLKKLKEKGYQNIIIRSKEELDLRNQNDVENWIRTEKPKVVIIAAAKVGGILANDRYPYDFLHDNLVIQNNLIHASHYYDVTKLIFLGSSCIYPKFAEQPLQEKSLLTGALEPTNQWYAIAKITGVKLCDAIRKQFGRDYISLMPTNLYGPGDNFDLETSHVLPAMMRKFHMAKIAGNEPVELWGTGKPKREFLHVDDVADAILFTLQRVMGHNLYNVGTGKDISISELAKLMQKITGHKGEIVWDDSKPDGTPRKLMDTSRLKEEGWSHEIHLEKGVQDTYEWFKRNIKTIREVKI